MIKHLIVSAIGARVNITFARWSLFNFSTSLRAPIGQVRRALGRYRQRCAQTSDMPTCTDRTYLRQPAAVGW